MTTEFRLPDIGEGIAEGEIVQWMVNAGDSVKEDQPLVEIMTDKVTAEIPSPFTGVIKELRGKPGDVIKVGSVIVVFEKIGAASGKKSAKAKEPVAAASSGGGNGKTAQASAGQTVVSRGGGKVLAAPATRKLARNLGLDLAAITGSGPRGRVTPDDVRRASQGGGFKTPATGSERTFGPVEEREERKPFAGMRRKIAEHLVHSKQVAPHFGYVEEVDMTEIVSIRKQLLPVAEQRRVKLTYLPFVMKAVIEGLKAFPIVNSTLDEDRQEIVLKHFYNLGVAVATDQGLVVPVVKHADRKSLFELASEVAALSDKARTGRLTLDDLKGGTFTLTSIGSIGGLFGLPIINYPEVAIMGVNKISQRPVVKDGQVVIREIMHLSLSADHRVVDGAEAALFMKKVVENLENPARFLMDV